MVYKFEYWKNLRSDVFERSYDKAQSKLFTIEEANFYALPYWLNHHSIFYRLVKDKMDVFMTSLKENDSNYIHYENKALNIDKFFNPYSRLSVIDYNDPSIREGLRITLICIDNMARACSENNIDLRVVIIPSDITVYAEFLYQNNSLKDVDKFDAIIESEKALKDSITSGLKERHIRYVDVLDSLKKHVSDKIYPKLEEGHPSPAGYRIIAEALAAQEKLPPQQH